jgi:hypothetical protein
MTIIRILRAVVVLIAIAGYVLTSGCSGPQPPPFTEVEGVVLLDGQRAIPNVQVEFVPELKHFGAACNSSAVTDEKGFYRLVSAYQKAPGALVGRHRVLIREQPIPPELRRERTEENEEKLRELRAKRGDYPIPAAYGNFSKTPLVVEVSQDKQKYDLRVNTTSGAR